MEIVEDHARSIGTESACLFVSVCVSLCLCLSLSLDVSLCDCLCLSVCVPVCLPVYLSLYGLLLFCSRDGTHGCMHLMVGQRIARKQLALVALSS